MEKQINIYAENLCGKAHAQFMSAMAMDFAVKGALMPDAHAGYSLPIGAVVASKDVVVPAWVGYDIGCGMCALPLSLTADEIEDHKQAIFDEIHKLIPVGFSKNTNSTTTHLTLDGLTPAGRKIAEDKDWLRALGSLGGGNHFIEVGRNNSGLVHIVIHSGSRGVGHGLATHYMKLASPTGRASEGHHGLATYSPEGQAYVRDLQWALEYALENRKEMMRRVVLAISHVLGCEVFPYWGALINRNHNHVEKKDGLWIHRKGATHAEDGMMGVIPANMKHGSFIVRGKGNPDSLCSSSHGAGRVMGRKEAKEKISLDNFKAQMAVDGIVATVDETTLDEAPAAYKNIFDVMDQQLDLVYVVDRVIPLINIKG